MLKEDLETLRKILAEQATYGSTDAKDFFKDLLKRANLPDNWVQETASVWTGDALKDALFLINWALNKGVNPKDKQYQTLGSILHDFLDDIGHDKAQKIATIIVNNQLYFDDDLLDNIKKNSG